MKETMETYDQQKSRHQKEVNDFKGIFFAFSNKQFEEGMQKLGLTKDDINKVCCIGCGGIVLKDKAKAFHQMIETNSQETRDSLKDDVFMLDALSYELSNHEYCITCDLTDTLECLELRVEDIKPEILKEARNLALRDC